MTKIPPILEKTMFGFMTSQILFTCHDLEIFELLDIKNYSLEELSKKLVIPKDSLERLLFAACVCHLLEYKNNKFFISKELKPYLVKKYEHYYGGRFSFYSKTSTKLSQFLKEAVKNNKPQWKNIDPQFEEHDLFSSIYKDPDSVKVFLDTMWNLSLKDSLEICTKYKFERYKHLVDIGGATGSFSIPALIENPSLKAQIFDKQEVKPHFLRKCKQYNLQSRLSFQEGNFFKDRLPKGDLYALGYILSDWSDKDSEKLLKKIFDSLPENGSVLILEKLLDEDKQGPFTTSMMNLVMLLETEGKHRTATEYKKLLETSGFSNLNIIKSSGEKHMIIGTKLGKNDD